MLPTVIRNLPMVIPQTEQQASSQEESRLAWLIQHAAHLDESIAKVDQNSSEAYIFFRQDDTFCQLERELSDLVQAHNNLQCELDDKRSDRLRQKENSPENTPKYEHTPSKETEERVTTRNKTILEKLYRKICLKTHPDKTNNKELHKLFHMGTRLYENGDIQGLEELLDLISAASGKVASARNKARDYIKKKIQEYENIVNVKTNQLYFLKSSPGYQLYVIKESNYPERALYIANQGMVANIQRIKQAIRQLQFDLDFL